MKITLNLRPELLDQAMRAAGVSSKTEIITLGLEELIAKASRRRLIKLGGLLKTSWAPERRKNGASLVKKVA
jgi:hypothetical protein